MSEKIKVLLADDHPMFIAGVKNALQQYDNLEIVAECTDGRQVLALLHKQPVDVAVLDVNMPEASGVEVARIIQQQFPDTGVVFLTMYQPAEINPVSFRHPYALGYVLKNSGSEVLYQAILKAGAGERFLDPRLSAIVGAEQSTHRAETIKLSNREKEIIKSIMLGKTNKEIGDALFVSELTVKTHRKNIYNKLSVNNTSMLILKVQQMGILS